MNQKAGDRKAIDIGKSNSGSGEKRIAGYARVAVTDKIGDGDIVEDRSGETADVVELQSRCRSVGYLTRIVMHREIGDGNIVEAEAAARRNEYAIAAIAGDSDGVDRDAGKLRRSQVSGNKPRRCEVAGAADLR